MTFEKKDEEYNLFISTHTLTWSVTGKRYFMGLGMAISTHTLTWSVTVTKLELLSKLPISTHTLTWSVTGVAHKCGEYQGFQLTRSRGA